MEHAESIVVHRPATEVWALTGHPESWQRWIRDIEDVRVDGELSEGTVVSYRWRGRDVTATVRPYEPGVRMGIQSSEKNYDFHESIALRDVGGRTEVTFTMGFTPTAWWMKAAAVLLSPFKGLVLGRSLNQELRALRDAAEGGTS